MEIKPRFQSNNIPFRKRQNVRKRQLFKTEQSKNTHEQTFGSQGIHIEDEQPYAPMPELKVT